MHNINSYSQRIGLIALTLLTIGTANAFPHGGPAFRNSAPHSINRPANFNRDINRNVNRNVNRNINVDRHVDVDVHGHGGGWYDDDYHHPVATAVAVTAAVGVTAAVVGSIVRSIPSGCTAVVANGITYQQCGSTWYQPQYAGTTVQYVVVNPPR